MSEANTWCDHNYSVSCSLPAGHEGPHMERIISNSAAEERGYQRGLAEAATAQRALSRIGDRLQYHGEVCPPGRLRQLLLAAAKDARTAAAPGGKPQVDDAVVEYGHGYVQGRADALEERAELAQELERGERTERMTYLGQPCSVTPAEHAHVWELSDTDPLAAHRLMQEYVAREEQEQSKGQPIGCATYPCDLLEGHDGPHVWASTNSDPRCSSRRAVGTCELYAGHDGEHRHGRVAWSEETGQAYSNGGIVDAHGMPVEEQQT